jgi:hypothetical protein
VRGEEAAGEPSRTDGRLDPLHLDLSARKKGRSAGQEWRRRVDRCEWQEQESEDQEEAVHLSTP